MPFPQQNSLPFIRPASNGSIQASPAFTASTNGTTWIYVGKADDLRARLLEHLGNTDIFKHQPTHYVTMVTTDIDNAERALIVELQPVANQRVG